MIVIAFWQKKQIVFRKKGMAFMSIIEIVGSIVLLIACVLIVILGLMQDSKQDQNMTSAITGGSYDSHFSKNEGNTKEARLKRWTTILCVLFFVVTLVVLIVPVWFNGSSAG